MFSSKKPLISRRGYTQGVDWINFDPEDALELLTGISPECQAGHCEGCPGFGGQDGKTIFCTHDCHKISEAELNAIRTDE